MKESDVLQVTCDMMEAETEQLPASDYSPIQFAALEWDEREVEIRILEIKLAILKSDAFGAAFVLPRSCS